MRWLFCFQDLLFVYPFSEFALLSFCNPGAFPVCHLVMRALFIVQSMYHSSPAFILQ